MRTILAELPSRLADDGRFQIITWSPGTDSGPLLVDLIRDALPDSRLTVHVLDLAPLEQHLEPFLDSPHYPAFRARLDAQGFTDVYFLYVHAAPSATGGVEILTPEAEVDACDTLSDPWI